jgi:hypothetical protein
VKRLHVQRSALSLHCIWNAHHCPHCPSATHRHPRSPTTFKLLICLVTAHAGPFISFHRNDTTVQGDRPQPTHHCLRCASTCTCYSICCIQPQRTIVHACQPMNIGCQLPTHIQRTIVQAAEASPRPFATTQTSEKLSWGRSTCNSCLFVLPNQRINHPGQLHAQRVFQQTNSPTRPPPSNAQ